LDLRRTEEVVRKGNTYTLGDSLKDITDAMIFDAIEEFPSLPGLTSKKFEEYAKIANDQIQLRLYGKPEQVTYMNGELPQTLQDNFATAMTGTPFKCWAYHGHREMTYALGHMFNIDWSFLARSGIPPTAVPAATTVFFELHRTNGEYFVETWIWAPCFKNKWNGEEIHAKDHQSKGIDCPATLIQLKGCNDTHCPYDQWKAIVDNKIKATGTWKELCVDDYSPDANPTPVQASSIATDPFLLFLPSFYIFAIFCSLGVLLCLIGLWHKLQKRDYLPLR